ncbi:unnamed protein product [Rotaria sordida]|uniref:Uncharacterized protein n=1 Tax=Rotaria sordida TaxID=392033 RepID=A0A815PPC2_9BILA|nr:unnamed protein product [Rotaria sordida]CAF1451595.1 unnamed protein product [Rotaria sordida]
MFKFRHYVWTVSHDIGEIEYTPTESERTSQDYIIISKSKTRLLLELLTVTSIDEEKLIRNRVLHSLYFNEQPWHIHPIASEESSELRYLHSTQNLFNYISNYDNNTFLYVKLLRGRSPIKTIDCNVYMLFRRTLIGDKIPICHVKDHVISLVNPDLPVFKLNYY